MVGVPLLLPTDVVTHGGEMMSVNMGEGGVSEGGEGRTWPAAGSGVSERDGHAG
jgi:hypothetical protein